MRDFASLCVLAYKRPDRLKICLQSILENTKNFPYELIVNLDADNLRENRDYLFSLLNENKISKLVMVNGNNRGVGQSLSNCIGVAEGRYIVKIDSDLEFTDPTWLEVGTTYLARYPKIAAISFFDYRNYDPNDKRFVVQATIERLKEVNDFVSSIYIFRASDAQDVTGWKLDDGYHQVLKASYNRRLAITDTDMVKNSGFGVVHSTYVSGTENSPYKTPTFPEPFIFYT